MDQDELPIPTVHLNGTSGDELLEQINEARTSLLQAMRALNAARPHGRDYYMQPDGAYARARHMHSTWYNKLDSVFRELEEIGIGVCRQIDERKKAQRK